MANAICIINALNTPLSFLEAMLKRIFKGKKCHSYLAFLTLFLSFILPLFYLVSFFFLKDMSAGCGLFFSQKFILLHFQSYFARYVLFCASFQNFKDVISERTLMQSCHGAIDYISCVVHYICDLECS